MEVDIHKIIITLIVFVFYINFIVQDYLFTMQLKLISTFLYNQN